ncbi:MAG: hypothetical protein ACI4LE_03265 [Faecalibacterium sp.]
MPEISPGSTGPVSLAGRSPRARERANRCRRLPSDPKNLPAHRAGDGRIEKLFRFLFLEKGTKRNKIPRFPQDFTFVKMMLEKTAKDDSFGVKKSSKFRLENTNGRHRAENCRTRCVENSVEKVEIHPENGREGWTFSLFPQGFQLVEKKMPLLQAV